MGGRCKGVCQGLSRPTKNKRSLHHIRTKLVWSKVWEKDRAKLSYGLYSIKQLWLTLGDLLFSNLITFLFLVHFKHFEVLQEHHLKFYKLFWNYNKNIVTYKELFGCSITNICNFWWFVMIFNELDAPIERVQVWFQHPKQWNPPFELPEVLQIILEL